VTSHAVIPTTITALTVCPAEIALTEPFGIATGAQYVARNVFVCVTLSDGTVGTGEAAPFPAVNGETQEMAERAIVSAQDLVLGQDARSWRRMTKGLHDAMESSPSARCAVETAVLDALARHWQTSLWCFFGGAQATLETDWTVTTGSPEQAGAAAARISQAGFGIIKLKVGGVCLDQDMRRIEAVMQRAPSCALIVDANGGMPSVDDALRLLFETRRMNAPLVLFEQPLSKHDHNGMAEVTARAQVPVAADESATSVAHVARIARRREASAINVKITKSGVAEALDMALAARALGLKLMMGAMVESPVAIAMGACLAGGLGGFDWVDLDTAFWMQDPPVQGGCPMRGPHMDVSDIHMGHGAHCSDSHLINRAVLHS
jgi:L-alanine-DL-glutamate epimerase-like enolase superfamily enzyme